jgi:predicted metal-dependent enzyme (double-stranded beta helix superfamily)
MAIEFPGRNDLIGAIDTAVAAGDEMQTMRALRSSLCAAIHSDSVRLPACVFENRSDHYARRELYRSAAHGYTVVAMTWNPGQGTPIHDHAGMWCVEGVWRGALEVVQYELLERDEPCYRLRPVTTMQASAGSAGSLIPPHDHHSIRNASSSDIAVSVHVYQGRMSRCSVFEPAQGQWYRRERHALSFDEITAALAD